MPRLGWTGRAPLRDRPGLLVRSGFPSIFDGRFAPAPTGAVAQTQRRHVFAEERLPAPDAGAPTNLPDHAGRIVVRIQHRLPTRAAIVRPALRFNEALPVALDASGPRSLGYSAGTPLAAATPLATSLSRLCGRRCRALGLTPPFAPCNEPGGLGFSHRAISQIRSRCHMPNRPCSCHTRIARMTPPLPSAP